MGYPKLRCPGSVLPVHLQLGLVPQTSPQGQAGDISKERFSQEQISERILELERTLFTVEVFRDRRRYEKTRQLFLLHKALLTDLLSGSVLLLLTFLRQTDVDRFYHNHYREGEETLSQQLSHILISDELQDKVKSAKLIVRLHVKHEDYIRVRNRLGQGLGRTTSVDNLLALTPPRRHVERSSLMSGLDLAVVRREDRSCTDGIDDYKLKFTARQVQAAVRTGREKSELQARQLQELHQKQMQTAREDTEALVRSLSKEVTTLTEQKEKAEKILGEHKLEIQQLQEINKNLAAQVEELLSVKHTAKGGSQGQGYGTGEDPSTSTSKKTDARSRKRKRLPGPEGKPEASTSKKVTKVDQTDLRPKLVGDLLTIDLSNKGLTSVPAEVFEARDVECLDLSNNRLTSIPEVIGQLQKLRELRLRNNQLTQLPRAITTLPKLWIIILNDNMLETLPDGFSRLQLHKLFLGNNRFKEIPEEVCSLLQLNTLIVTNNLRLKYLPGKIVQLTQLRTVGMEGCHFDEFPRQVLQLEGLETLYMGDWAGKGKPSPVPEEIGRLKNLQDLSLCNSGLESLPDGVGELMQLTVLNISGNRFTSVPEQIMNLSNIEIILLENNRISCLPLTLIQLAKLKYMDISGNPLTYPPPDVCKKGTAAIMDFLRKEKKEKEDRELRQLLYRFSQTVTERQELEAVAGALGLTADVMASILAIHQTPSFQAYSLLLKWMEVDREATLDKLQQELSDIGMDRLAEEARRIKEERLKWPADTSGGPSE